MEWTGPAERSSSFGSMVGAGPAIQRRSVIQREDMRTMVLVFLVILANGWAGAMAGPAATTAPSLPAPTSFEMSGTVEINLTPQMVAQTGLPSALRGTLEASAKSAATSASPLQSHHEGHLSLVITDASGKQSIANVNIKVSGDSAGSPTEGLGEVLRRFFNAVDLFSRAVPESGKPAR
jgi:hypothetical protein